MNRVLILILIFILNSIPFYAQINWYKWSEPTNLEKLNSKEDDFAPQWNNFENALYFNSNLSGHSLFYISEIDSNNEFKLPMKIDGGINSTMENQSYITFLSNDIAYFTSFNKTPKGSVFNIFESTLQKNTWQKGIILESLRTDDFCFHPTVAPNGNFIIFAQASPDNPEDSDLWIAFRNGDNIWQGLLRLDAINTNKSEITPFLASDDTLYFASNGFSGKGGYDIYYSINIDGIWQKPRPVADINTEYDESDFVVLPNNTAIFSSNRPNGKGKLDLWQTRRVPIEAEFNNQPEIMLSSYVAQIRINEDKYFIKTPISPFSQNFSELFRKINNNSNDLENMYFSEFNATPEILEINLQFENANNMAYWRMELISDSSIIYNETGKELNKKIQIDINNIAENIHSDSLTIQVLLFNQNDELIKKENKLSLMVFKSQKEKPFNLKDNAYSQAYLFAYPSDYASDWIATYQNSFEQIRNSTAFAKKIQIICPDNITKSEQDTIFSQIKLFFNGKKIIKNDNGIPEKFMKQLNTANCKYFIIIL